jgi:hypothetical protein
LFVIVSFFFCALCCLSFYSDYPLVSSNCSYLIPV